MPSTKIDYSENNIEYAVIEYAEDYGWFRRKVKWLGRKSAPDNMFARGGIIFFIEFKKTGKKPNPSQKREIKRMRDAGIRVYVIDNIPDGYQLFDEIESLGKLPKTKIGVA